MQTKKGKSIQTDSHDEDRRALLKTMAGTIGAAYIAPATLSLLLADRASAQSATNCFPTANASFRNNNFDEDAYIEFYGPLGRRRIPWPKGPNPEITITVCCDTPIVRVIGVETGTILLVLDLSSQCP